MVRRLIKWTSSNSWFSRRDVKCVLLPATLMLSLMLTSGGFCSHCGVPASSRGVVSRSPGLDADMPEA